MKSYVNALIGYVIIAGMGLCFYLFLHWSKEDVYFTMILCMLFCQSVDTEKIKAAVKRFE